MPLDGAALPFVLVRAGLLPPSRYLEAVGVVRDDAFWGRWARNAVLAVAVGQLLAGIAFFFAFNWAELPPFAKLGLIQGGIVLCAAGAWIGRRHQIAWEALLTAAAALVGVLLAVFGQIYQTGADAYTLFVGWGLLILPWVVLARALPLWVLWLTVAGVGGFTYAVQVAIPLDRIDAETTMVLLAAFYAVALLARELGARFGARFGFAWLQPLWLRRLLVFVVLGLTFFLAAPVVLDFGFGVEDGRLALVSFLLATIGLGAVYTWQRDLPAVVLAVLAGSLFLCTIGLRMAVDSDDLVGGSFLLLVVVAAVFGGALALLRRLRTWMLAHG